MRVFIAWLHSLRATLARIGLSAVLPTIGRLVLRILQAGFLQSLQDTLHVIFVGSHFFTSSRTFSRSRNSPLLMPTIRQFEKTSLSGENQYGKFVNILKASKHKRIVGPAAKTSF